MKENSGRRFLISILLASGIIAIITMSAFAQTKRKKPSPGPTPTPTATTGAEIISTADDQNPPLVFLDPAAVKQNNQPIDDQSQKVKDLTARIKKLEAARTNEYDEKQKRLLLNLDILTRAEQRADGLRKQLFEMIEKENTLKSRIDQIETESRPESINRSATFSGSMKPEEIREMRKRSLDAEKQNLQSLLNEVQSSHANLTATVQRADAMVEKLRFKLEKEIDDALEDPKDN
ncbi:MAG TPA: hypothetical protein PLD38_14160 [Pyrinomonadaceae bacterium]|nr:hypothetical protein [Chloracidobacterium sp.]MBP9936829.1 hypothetical protein [Pyrinomonadaceae bacterium]MBK7804075.1 hypothetical protein [Chloracidobacterium sp.]MBK9439253.1 hypothetical protein [Chloracidobacterium sp.]MBK9767068.1 hypothetical protein [Chloracidobacterium sp.]